MEELIQWLRSVEGLARALYAEAATQCSEDPAFSAFLRRLADDEGQHFDLMQRAEQFLGTAGELPIAAVVVDEEARQRIEYPLHHCFEQLKRREATRKSIIESLVQIESCELNDIFLYVLRLCQPHSVPLQEAAAIIQVHEERIETFLAQMAGAEDSLTKLRRLPRIWTNRYLVADDDPLLRDLFAALFEGEAEVITASNGEEALQAARETFFNVIVSDIEMPRMDGFEFFRRATQEHPGLARSFLFWSGSTEPEVEVFCRENNVPYLQKPVGLSALQQAVESVRGRST